jgi:hypothetical protein
MRNPAFTKLLERMAALHESKNADYASEGDPLSNFKEAAEVTRGFTGVDAVFASLIGVKLARLRELTAAGKRPNHESIEDTRTDLAMYAALWASYHVPESGTNVPVPGITHCERITEAQPCRKGCGSLTYPPGVCVGCKRTRRRKNP